MNSFFSPLKSADGSILVFFALALFSPHIIAAPTQLFIDRPEELVELENKGYHFAKWLSNSAKTLNNHDLYAKSARYKFIVDSLSKDLNTIARTDPRASVTMDRAHRLFNKRWLTSKSAHYELVGVINRMDRIDFHGGTCGEIRFIYRLAYKIKKKKQIIQSRLPLTFNVVSFLKGDCSKIAKSWRSLAPLNNSELKSVELNLQAVRWPSTIRPDFGGYAEYFLRVFTPKGETMTLGVLENTPDVSRLRKNKKLRLELLTWLSEKEQLKKLDMGTLVIPDKYLATEATSVALHGRARLFNQPFSRLFKEEDFKGIEFKNYSSFKTPFALIKRANDLSCVGCHQGRTVAGFHFLGTDRKGVSSVNAILSSFSAHFFNDQKRREHYWKALVNKEDTRSYRSLSVRAPHEKGSWGSHCSMGSDPSFSNWTCETGLVCQRYDLDKNSPLGTCLEAADASEGSPCKVGTYKGHDSPYKDRLLKQRRVSCRDDLICEETSVGFPGGMCSGNCSKLGEDATCGSIAVLYGFNRCLSRGKPFADCLSNNVRPGSLRGCHSTKHCRDDYICAKTQSGSGGCIPPYFLFQLRVDGHPKPD